MTLEWHRDKGEAEAHGRLWSHYEVKHPFAVYDHLEARWNGVRLATVDNVDEGIRLCEWHERAL